MNFNSKKVAFGRHESFQLRFGWLTKGFQAFEQDHNIFANDDAVVTLGVGKNMVNSIRHWLRAAQLIKLDSEKKEVTVTEIGSTIFSNKNGWDPYLEDEATIWLIHWLISTNPIHATSWYWFFNKFHKPEFSNTEVSNALSDFVKEKIKTKFSITSVKKDCSVLLRSYVQSRGKQKSNIEDALDSPLSLLKLITFSITTKNYQSKFEHRDSLPIGIFGFAICDLLKQRQLTGLPIEDLMYGRDGYAAPGLIFRLSENALLTKIEQLIQYIPGIFKLDNTAGIHQLFQLKEIEPFKFLEKHYEYILQDKVA